MVEYDLLPDNFFLNFSRNLSYTEECYLDNFSTCAPYVNHSPSHNRKGPVIGLFESRLCYPQGQDEWTMLDSGDSMSNADEKAAFTEMSSAKADDKSPTDDTSVKKGDLSEVCSEEGIFVNMMDDLESIDSQKSRDSVSDISYFSLESPEESKNVEEFDQMAQQALSQKVIDRLAKTECLRKTASAGDIGSKKTDEVCLKKAPSEGILETKLASLKIEIRGSKNDGFFDANRYLLQIPDSPIFDEPEFNINKSELRKSSSLKSNKTPPGTPSRKKIVRFADAMGLDLESIRHVLDTDRPPKIPASAIADLKEGLEEDRKHVGSRYLDLCFPQPGASDGFLAKVMANKVCLENCVIADLSITGIVRVANIGYHKCVRIRYTINNWITFYDVMASYIQNSCNGTSDRFSFTIVAPAAVGPGSRMAFAASYTVNDTIYWDSNDGKNYEVVCYAKTTPTELETSWVHFV